MRQGAPGSSQGEPPAISLKGSCSTSGSSYAREKIFKNQK